MQAKNSSPPASTGCATTVRHLSAVTIDGTPITAASHVTTTTQPGRFAPGSRCSATTTTSIQWALTVIVRASEPSFLYTGQHWFSIKTTISSPRVILRSRRESC